jgi:DNA-binding LacI/PurR family transcriptional regulator
MSTLKEIAQAVGVSVATISLYVNDNDTKRIGAETKKKIQKAIDDIGYLPNESARTLRGKASRSIGIILPFQGTFFRSSFLCEVISGIQSVLVRNGYAFAFLPTTSRKLSDVISKLIHEHNKYDGYIVVGTRFSTLEDIKETALFLKNNQKKFVVLNMPQLGIDVNQVLPGFSALMTPLKYLEDMGHSNILLVHGVQESPDTQYVQQQLALQGKRYPVVYGAYEREITKTAIDAYFTDHGESITAIYCLTDTMALGVYDYLREKHLSIPDDVSVVGRNDSYFDTLLTPPLTTVRRKSFTEGEKAATILLTSFDTDVPLTCAVPGELVIRDSVKSIVKLT